jgi:hypothetical protein
VQGPFGTINDVANAEAGVLSAWLAWRLRREMPGRAADLAVGAALLGAAVTVVGSTLVISGTTGFFLAGLVSSVGFAGIGTWLVVLNRSAGAATWPGRIRTLGVAAGALMALGVIVVPGIFLRLDDMATAPAWVWVGSFGWLGTFVVYPAWALWLGRFLTRPSRSSPSAAEGCRHRPGHTAGSSWAMIKRPALPPPMSAR